MRQFQVCHCRAKRGAKDCGALWRDIDADMNLLWLKWLDEWTGWGKPDDEEKYKFHVNLGHDFDYVVDLKNMTQTRIKTGYERELRVCRLD